MTLLRTFRMQICKQIDEIIRDRCFQVKIILEVQSKEKKRQPALYQGVQHSHLDCDEQQPHCHICL